MLFTPKISFDGLVRRSLAFIVVCLRCSDPEITCGLVHAGYNSLYYKDGFKALQSRTSLITKKLFLIFTLKYQWNVLRKNAELLLHCKNFIDYPFDVNLPDMRNTTQARVEWKIHKPVRSAGLTSLRIEIEIYTNPTKTFIRSKIVDNNSILINYFT